MWIRSAGILAGLELDHRRQQRVLTKCGKGGNWSLRNGRSTTARYFNSSSSRQNGIREQFETLRIVEYNEKAEGESQHNNVG